MSGGVTGRRKSLLLSAIWLIASVCVALVGLDTARTWRAYHNRIAEIGEATDNLVRSLADHVGDAIGTVETDLAGIRQRLAAEGTSPDDLARLRATLHAQLAAARHLRGFSVFDATGAMLLSTTDPTAPAHNNADRDYFEYWRTHDDDRAYIGGPYRSRSDGAWVISISRRFDRAGGGFGGVVAGTIALAEFTDYDASFAIGQHGILLLTRADGTVIARRPAAAAFTGRRPVESELFAAIIPDAPAGRFDAVSGIDGVARIGSFRRIPDYGLVATAALDRTEVLADWQSEAAVHAGGVFLMVVIVVLLGLRLTARIADDARRTDDRLRQSEKMEVIGRLAAGVAHDFNNILQVILGGSEVLADEPDLSDAGRSFLQEVETAASRGSQLTHHLLSYARQQLLSPKPLALDATLERLRLVLSRTVRANIALIIDVAPGIDGIRADPIQLQTALINLAINAEHAMPEGGTLHVAARMGEASDIGDLKPGRYVVIAMTDTGSGMTPEVLSRAFDPFFTTKGLAGSGLGLPMVQGFSRQTGGDVRVLSAPGQGTTVEVWLPSASPPTVRDSVKPAPALRAGPGRVLLVDDSPEVLAMVEATLRKGGFAVQRATNGYEALAALANGARFDLIVTDYMMPGLNGPALIRHARSFQPGLPAVIMSGFADARVDLADAAFLPKPFQREQLLASVNAVAGG